MKDEKGLYYYPYPQNHDLRMYVRKDEAGEICFRFWNRKDQQLWEKHGWVPYDVIKKAMAMYKGGGIDPNQAYDPVVAGELLKREGDG